MKDLGILVSGVRAEGSPAAETQRAAPLKAG